MIHGTCILSGNDRRTGGAKSGKELCRINGTRKKRKEAGILNHPYQWPKENMKPNPHPATDHYPYMKYLQDWSHYARNRIKKDDAGLVRV
jgi:hypothetical protein